MSANQERRSVPVVKDKKFCCDTDKLDDMQFINVLEGMFLNMMFFMHQGFINSACSYTRHYL